MPTHLLSPGRARAWSALALAAALVVSTPASPAHAAATVVPLGVTKNFSVLAGSTVTNTGTTTVNRGVGLHPGSAITGRDTMTIGGEVHVRNDVARRAKLDLTTAYDDAAGQSPRTAADAELAGETLVGGVYNRPAAMALNGQLVLDGRNDPDSVWVFQAGTSLVTGSGSSIVLIRGADPCRVFWQVGSSATLGTGTRFVGTVMADQSITMQTGARLQGRAFALEGAVTLDTNVISSPTCRDSDDDGPVDGPGGGGPGGPGDGDDDGDDGPGGGAGDGGSGSGGGDGGDGGGGSQISNPPSGGVPTGDALAAPSGSLAVTASLLGLLLAAGLAGLALRLRPRTVPLHRR